MKDYAGHIAIKTISYITVPIILGIFLLAAENNIWRGSLYKFYSPIRSINLPYCTEISSKGWSIFTRCDNLETINLENCKNFKESLANLNKLQSVSLQSCDDIPYACFRKCGNLKNVNLNNCKTINKYAFESCKSLKQLDLPKCTKIGDNAFQDSAIQTLHTPNLQTIQNGTFENCKNLKEINLQNCKEIGNYVFLNCQKLETLIVPSSCKIDKLGLPIERIISKQLKIIFV